VIVAVTVDHFSRVLRAMSASTALFSFAPRGQPA
jgi:hypothetical protein